MCQILMTHKYVFILFYSIKMCEQRSVKKNTCYVFVNLHFMFSKIMTTDHNFNTKIQDTKRLNNIFLIFGAT